MSGCECRVCGYYHPGEGCVIDDALVSKLARERDEARAEVERLREVLDEVVKRLVPLTPVILAAMQAKREGE